MIEPLLLALLLVFSTMLLFFALSLVLKDNSIVDIAWGLNFIVASLAVFLTTPCNQARQIIVVFLIALWGLRLAVHILSRKLRTKGEDYRYKEMRERWGDKWVVKSFVNIYLFQGFLSLIIAGNALVLLSTKGNNFNIIDILGIFVWTFGFVFETVSDGQLRKFTSDPKNKGKIMQSGLWKHSRHPNYFGEITMWWGIFILSLNHPYWWITFISPLTITLFIIFVSGIPLLEKKYADNKEFKEYAKKTPILVPFLVSWFCKK